MASEKIERWGLAEYGKPGVPGPWLDGGVAIILFLLLLYILYKGV